MNSEVRGYMGL